MKKRAGLQANGRKYFKAPFLLNGKICAATALLLAGCLLMLASCSGRDKSSSSQQQSSSGASSASEGESSSLPQDGSEPDISSSSQGEGSGGVNDNLNAGNNINPFTGLAVEEGLPEDTRPLAVMVDNSPSARPQRGICEADMVLEMLCEGGYSSMMLFYANPAAIPSVGPVCAARDQFIQFAMPVNGIPAHIGTTAYASNLLNLHGYQDLDGIYIGKISYAFDTARHNNPENPKANEFCWFTDASLIQAGISHTGLLPNGQVKNMFTFSEKDVIPTTAASTVDIKYWSNSSAQLIYNGENERYTKNTGIGEGVQSDENGSPLVFDNVIVLLSEVTKKPDNYCSEYDLKEGQGYYFTRGAVMEISWVKGMPQDSMLLYDANGDFLEINTGKTYLAVVPIGGEAYVSYS